MKEKPMTFEGMMSGQNRQELPKKVALSTNPETIKRLVARLEEIKRPSVVEKDAPVQGSGDSETIDKSKEYELRMLEELLHVGKLDVHDSRDAFIDDDLHINPEAFRIAVDRIEELNTDGEVEE